MLKIAFTTLMMSIVISAQEIRDALPVGTSEEEVKAYLMEVAGSYVWLPREVRELHFPWLESGIETGYYAGTIRNVQARWWLPAFGGYWTVRVGISSEGKVTQVVTIGGRSGWP